MSSLHNCNFFIRYMLKCQYTSKLRGCKWLDSSCQYSIDSTVPLVVSFSLSWELLGSGNDDWYETGIPPLGNGSIWLNWLSPTSNRSNRMFFYMMLNKIHFVCNGRSVMMMMESYIGRAEVCFKLIHQWFGFVELCYLIQRFLMEESLSNKQIF